MDPKSPLKSRRRAKQSAWAKVSASSAIASDEGNESLLQPVAQHKMAMKCFFGRDGQPKDYEKAFEWWMKASKARDEDDKGLVQALYNLGYCYMKGLGCTRDAMKAARYFARVGEAGVVVAEQYLKGLMDIGDGAPGAFGSSIALIRQSMRTAANPAELEFKLGLHYFEGNEVQRNVQQALRPALK